MLAFKSWPFKNVAELRQFCGSSVTFVGCHAMPAPLRSSQDPQTTTLMGTCFSRLWYLDLHNLSAKNAHNTWLLAFFHNVGTVLTALRQPLAGSVARITFNVLSTWWVCKTSHEWSSYQMLWGCAGERNDCRGWQSYRTRLKAHSFWLGALMPLVVCGQYHICCFQS